MKVKVTYSYIVPDEVALAIVPEGYGSVYDPGKKRVFLDAVVAFDTRRPFEVSVKRDPTPAESLARRDANAYDDEVS